MSATLTLGAVLVKTDEPILDVLHPNTVRLHLVVLLDMYVQAALLILDVMFQIRSFVLVRGFELFGQCVMWDQR